MDVLYIRDISQLVFWVPINNGNSEPNAEEVVDEVVEAEVLVLGAGMDVFLRHTWQLATIFETQIMTYMRVTWLTESDTGLDSLDAISSNA